MSINNILFVDIETVPQYESYEQLPNDWKELWNKKAESILKQDENETLETSYNRAGLYAEFGRIVCISCGLIKADEKGKQFTDIRSFSGEDEHKILTDFAAVLSRCKKPNFRLCAHNGKAFDFPYICRRMLVNNINIPAIVNTNGKKPWEIDHIDTMEMWKFGDFKNFTSLALMATALGIPSPKDDIDGSMVQEVFYKEKNLERIVTYCEKDVATLSEVYIKLAKLLSLESQ